MAITDLSGTGRASFVPARALPYAPSRTSVATTATRLAAEARAVVTEARPAVQVLAAVRVACASGLLRHPSPQRLLVLAGWVLLSMAVYVHNGITDVRADRRNGSTRPVASGRLSEADARRWVAALLVSGLVAASVGGPDVAALGAIFVVLGWSYSSGPCWKNSPFASALVIGIGAGLSYAAGMAVAHDGAARDLLVMLFVAAWVGVGSMSKDFSDIAGDALSGRRTVPVVFGTRAAARRLARHTLLTAVAVALIAPLMHSAVALLPGVTLLAGSVVLTAAALRFGGRRGRSARRRPYRVFMATQYSTDATLFAVLAA